jgi:rhamnose transport system ATP-binding protein
MLETSPVIKTKDIYKSFAGVEVLKSANIELHPGEVHALVGENGAGKSTLVKIIAGIHTPSSGILELEGKEVEFQNPKVATLHGISLIHQEPLAFPDLTVAENIFIGSEPCRYRINLVDWPNIYRRSSELLQSLGLNLDPRTKMRGVPIADQQMVDMAAALSQKAKVLLMDEPTAALTPNEVEHLFSIIQQLKKQGVAIAFISHRLEEVTEIADCITIMRDGEVVGERLPKSTSHEEIIRLMVGRPLKALFEKVSGQEFGKTALRVQDLSCKKLFNNISFDLREGEILGVAGLVGAGRSNIAQCLFGILPAEHGTIWINDKKVTLDSPKSAMAHGLAYVPEDRQNEGLLLPMTITQNMTLPIISRFSLKGFLRNNLEREAVHEYVERLRIILRHVEQPVAELSGGNQQKVVLSRWLMTKPKVIILDEPTRGIDVGAKAEVHRLMGELASQGMGILMISSELPEIIAMSDRVIVLREGSVVARLEKDELSAEKIMAAAAGEFSERV